MEVTLYHRKTGGAVKVWSCKLHQGGEVSSRWGQQGGKMSSTVERFQSNSRMTAMQKAEAAFLKKVDRRKRKGYVERLDSVVDTVAIVDSEFDFTKPLPRSFAPAKPNKTFDLTTMTEWERQDRILVQRKRDGMRHYLVSDSKGRVRVYSSGKEDMTEHLLPLIKDLRPNPNAIFDCELVVTEPGKDERDGFLIVSGIARSLPERAREQIRLAERMGARVQLMAFDLLWWEGKPVYKQHYEYRYKKLQTAIDFTMSELEAATLEGYPPLIRMPLVAISPTRLATLAESIEMVRKNKWEGLVIWRRDQATVVQQNGSPKRVNCWKMKPIQEDDVVAYGFEKGRGKNSEVVGKFLIGFYMNGRKWKPMGRCGTGLDDATRAAALKWTYPCVIQIEYDQRSEKGFRFPVYLRKRDDKSVTECVG